MQFNVFDMFWLFLTCNDTLAASGIFFHDRNDCLASARFPRGPQRPEYLFDMFRGVTKSLLISFVTHPEGGSSDGMSDSHHKDKSEVK